VAPHPWRVRATQTIYAGAAPAESGNPLTRRTLRTHLRQASVQAIGALAVAPPIPNRLGGTGELGYPRSDSWRWHLQSVDAGETWQHMASADRTHRASHRHPKIPTSSTPARSTPTGPQQERGVFRPRTAARPWIESVRRSRHWCSGLTIDVNTPTTSSRHVASGIHSWACSARAFERSLSTHDGGTHGLASKATACRNRRGQDRCRVAPSNGKRVYALIQTPDQARFGAPMRRRDGLLKVGSVS